MLSTRRVVVGCQALQFIIGIGVGKSLGAIVCVIKRHIPRPARLPKPQFLRPPWAKKAASSSASVTFIRQNTGCLALFHCPGATCWRCTMARSAPLVCRPRNRRLRQIQRKVRAVAGHGQ